MKELQNILAQTRELKATGAKAVLATVVDVQGSSYRLPGAKMLILESGETFGIVSGGCLEVDVAERARAILQTGEPQVLTYDTGGKDDSVFALNMGCSGIVRILLEPATSNAYFDFVRKCFETRRSGVAATLIRTGNLKISPQTGSRVFISENEIWGKDFGKEIEELISAESQAAFENDRSGCQTLQTATGNCEFFFEIIKPPLSLVVFGAGADAVPLVELSKNLGWRVSVIDHRPAFATKERFPAADEILISRDEKLTLEPASAAVVMTHNYEHDRRILRAVLKSPAKYVGVLGPKRRTENLLTELAAEGRTFTADEMKKLFAPVGLDIGADTPEAIALSIVAEIQAVLANRDGGFLRNRRGSIYNRNKF